MFRGAAGCPGPRGGEREGGGALALQELLRVDFRNAVIIMTSNIGAESLVKGQSLGFGIDHGESGKQREHDWQRMKSNILDAVKKVFRPEFLNRINAVCWKEAALRKLSAVDPTIAGE